MYDNQTYEKILERMLSRVPDNISKREGSFIYDALSPAALELANAYYALSTIQNKMSIDTSTGDELTELCFQNGTFRKGASKAIRKGEFNVSIPIGSRFNTEGVLSFVAIEQLDGYNYKLECEQEGEIGNFYTGPLFPISNIDGLTTANLTDLITPGVEEESDEQLKERHKRRVIEGEQDGNIAQYRDWAEKFDGIGAVKVFPLWNGGNTIKVSITNRLYQVADSTLVNEFQEYLDPNSEGLGNGVAPIGSKVTVSGGIRKDIDIAGAIILAEGYTGPEGVAETVSKYLASITYSKNSVSYMRTAVAILDTPSIVDLNNFTINGGIEDIQLIAEEIPVLNSINLTVVGP